MSLDYCGTELIMEVTFKLDEVRVLHTHINTYIHICWNIVL
jgi:hypothetical protein